MTYEYAAAIAIALAALLLVVMMCDGEARGKPEE